MRSIPAGCWNNGPYTWDGGNCIWCTPSRLGEVQVLDMQGTPTIIGRWNVFPGTPERIVIWQGRALIPCGFAGLYIQTGINHE